MVLELNTTHFQAARVLLRVDDIVQAKRSQREQEAGTSQDVQAE
jgi:hypothetical protein